MIFTLQNDRLTLQIAARGAELISAVAHDGCSYIWSGDPAFWGERAPWLFPFCGRLPDAKYTHNGAEYAIPIHGFARHQDFSVVEACDTSLTLSLYANGQTRAQFPFDFCLTIAYQLTENRLSITATIENTGKDILPATFGAHPGFCLPLDADARFTDYVLEFGAPCTPQKIVFSERGLCTGERVAFPLHNAVQMDPTDPEISAIGLFLANTAKSISLRAKEHPHGLTVEFPEAPYLGFWRAGSDAPFLCIEPWFGLPSVEKEHEELCKKNDLFRILPRECKSVELAYIFE